MKLFTNPKRAISAALLATVALVSLTACKATEQYNDAPSSNGGGDKSPAAVYAMPDGFSNWAEKCDGHGFRVFVAFHSGSAPAIAAVADPTCK